MLGMMMVLWDRKSAIFNIFNIIQLPSGKLTFAIENCHLVR